MGQCVKDYSLKYFSCLGAPGGLHHRYFFLLLSRSSWPCSRMVGSHGISLTLSGTATLCSKVAMLPDILPSKSQDLAGECLWFVLLFIYLFFHYHSHSNEPTLVWLLVTLTSISSKIPNIEQTLVTFFFWSFVYFCCKYLRKTFAEV